MSAQSVCLLVTASAAMLLSLAAGAAATGPRCHAYDGDTLYCGNERIRLYDVYAAELSEAGGRAARANLRRMIQSGELKIVRHGTDRYGRTLADLYVNGRKVVQEDVGPRTGRGLRSGYASQPR